MADEYGHKLRAFPLRMPDEIRDALSAQADNDRVSLNTLIVKILADYLNESSVDTKLDEIFKRISAIEKKLP